MGYDIEILIRLRLKDENDENIPPLLLTLYYRARMQSGLFKLLSHLVLVGLVGHISIRDTIREIESREPSHDVYRLIRLLDCFEGWRWTGTTVMGMLLSRCCLNLRLPLRYGWQH